MYVRAYVYTHTPEPMVFSTSTEEHIHIHTHAHIHKSMVLSTRAEKDAHICIMLIYIRICRYQCIYSVTLLSDSLSLCNSDSDFPLGNL